MTEADKERAEIVAWLRKQMEIEHGALTDYRGKGDTIGALCYGERLLAYSTASQAIESLAHKEHRDG